jgi:hypothetical protein
MQKSFQYVKKAWQFYPFVLKMVIISEKSTYGQVITAIGAFQLENLKYLSAA